MISVLDQHSQFMGLGTGFTWAEVVEQGIKRLGEMIREMRDEL